MRRKFAEHGCRFEHKWHSASLGMLDSKPPNAEALDDGCWMSPVYGRDGGYVGDAGQGAHFRWLARHGVFIPLLARADHRCSSVGKVTKGEHAGKWLGWSHRAAVPFGTGDMVFDPEAWDDAHPGEDSDRVPFIQRGVKPVVDESDAREAAASFACYVS